MTCNSCVSLWDKKGKIIILGIKLSYYHKLVILSPVIWRLFLTRIRSVISKGPKYRSPAHINFTKCREAIAKALNDYYMRWCKLEHVESNALNNWKLNIFQTIDKRISFYLNNLDLLPPKPKFCFRHLKQEIQEFHRKHVLVPADKAANNVHCCHITTTFAVGISENEEKLPTLYWLPKLHKRPYKPRFIANSSSCTTTELSKLLTSCLTAVKIHSIKYYDTCYERDGINRFCSIKNSNAVLNKLKSKGFKASTLSTYDFSTLYTTLPQHLIKDTLVDFIEHTFSREKALYLACNDQPAFFTSDVYKNYSLWSCQKVC